MVTTDIAVLDERRGCTSASNAAADQGCPGRHLAQKGLPSTTSKDSEHGRLIHAALAGDGEALRALTVEQRDTFERCREIEKKLLAQYFPDAGGSNPLKVFREQRYWVLVDGKFEHSGKFDLVVRCGPQGMVIDYKTLPGDVDEAPDNQQLRDGVVLLAGHLLVEEMAAVIIQPMVSMEPKVALYGPEDIERSRNALFERVRKSNDPASPRIASEVACKFCRAKSHCHEYQKWAGSSVPVMLTLLDVPMAQWTPEQRQIFCERLPVAQKWLDDAKDLIKEGLAKDPAFVPGYYLAPGAKRETIKDPQEVFNRFSTLGGTVNQFMGCVSVAKGKLKEALAEVTGGKGKSLDQAMKTITDGLVEVSQNAPSLKPKSEDKSA